MALVTASTQLAYALHKDVSPDRWCVTKENLKQLQREVYHDIQKGHIRPTPRDQFCPLDQVYGPSIYTVNEQHIKPVTAKAGKMSWALMLHPDGLQCHVFISHAWEEGIFEFLTKVKHSWPRGHRHAWCCMLANPQNLNIASLLQSPSQSPFAMALRASRTVLVVPNRHRSVYTRLWCAYEAYLAQAEGKPIAIASAPMQFRTWRSFTFLCLAGSCGVLVGMLPRNLDILHSKVLWLLVILALLGLAWQENEWSLLIHCLCEMLCWREIVALDGSFPTGEEWGFPESAYFYVHLWFWLMAASFFFLMERDRVHVLQSADEARLLRKGYQGSITFAECSQTVDRQRILKEIGEKVMDVDFAIHVLLSAGMSSPSLREIALKGVDIEHAVVLEFTAAAILLGPYDVMTLGHLLFDLYKDQDPVIVVLQAFSVLGRIFILGLLMWREIDERCFLLRVMSKMLTALIVMLTIVYSLVPLFHMPALLPWLIVFDTVLSLAVVLSSLGIRQLKERQLGLCLLNFIFARGKKVFTHSCGGEEPSTCSAAFEEQDSEASLLP